MVTDYFRKVGEFFVRNYRQHVRVDGERAMDNLMGTMIGVLFLAVISASFAGIFMAYTVSSAKATENTERNNLISKYSTNTLNNLYVESVNGKTTAIAAGWNVLSQGKPLYQTTSLTPFVGEDANSNGKLDTEDKNGNCVLDAGEDANSNGRLDTEDTNNNCKFDTFTNYTFAATRAMTTGGTITLSQWGKNEDGLVTLYTAAPKAGSGQSKCNWTETMDKLEMYCNVVIDTVQSVVAPPVGVEDQTKILWAQEINQFPWVNAASNWADDVKRDVKTTKLGEIQPNGTTEFKWVAMFENLQPNKTVTIDFVESTNNSVNTHKVTATPVAGETGNLTRSAHGTLTIPAGVTKVTAYIDTDFDNANTATDQTVKMYRFIVYTKK